MGSSHILGMKNDIKSEISSQLIYFQIKNNSYIFLRLTLSSTNTGIYNPSSLEESAQLMRS